MKNATKKATYQPSNDSDELNPAYLFSMTANELLCAIATGKLDPVMMAKKELANRGYSLENKWIGFDRAKKENV